MDEIIVAIYDLEVINNPDDVGGFGAYDRLGFAVGVVRFVRYIRRTGGQVHRAVLADNVHFGPVPFVDDLLRPMAHAIVGYNSRRFDNPVAVHSAVAELAGVRVRGPADDEGQKGATGVIRGRLDAAGLPPLAWTLPEAREEDTAETRAFRDWAHLGRRYSRLILPGTVGLSAPRAAVLEALNARTFDPLMVLAELTGHPHVCRLDYLREGLELKPYELDGRPVDGAEVPDMWRRGLVWQVVEKCRSDVYALEELLHQAFGGAQPRIFANRLNTTIGQGEDQRPCGHAETFRSTEVGGKWAFHIPTGDWWDRLATIAASSR